MHYGYVSSVPADISLNNKTSRDNLHIFEDSLGLSFRGTDEDIFQEEAPFKPRGFVYLSVATWINAVLEGLDPNRDDCFSFCRQLGKVTEYSPGTSYRK